MHEAHIRFYGVFVAKNYHSIYINSNNKFDIQQFASRYTSQYNGLSFSLCAPPCNLFGGYFLRNWESGRERERACKREREKTIRLIERWMWKKFLTHTHEKNRFTQIDCVNSMILNKRWSLSGWEIHITSPEEEGKKLTDVNHNAKKKLKRKPSKFKCIGNSDWLVNNLECSALDTSTASVQTKCEKDGKNRQHFPWNLKS